MKMAEFVLVPCPALPRFWDDEAADGGGEGSEGSVSLDELA